jgi:DNA-directed RNA polymerase specialized sigma24 family protein
LEALTKARAELEKLVGEIRPELHRYCARMTGSVVDGEDVVQDTLARAFYLLPQTAEIANLRSWLFRIAHNKAVDQARAYARRFGEPLGASNASHPSDAAFSCRARPRQCGPYRARTHLV